MARPKENDFFCACHEGYYDEFGTNISGPPPRPLDALTLEVTTDTAGKVSALTVWRDESVREKADA